MKLEGKITENSDKQQQANLPSGEPVLTTSSHFLR